MRQNREERIKRIIYQTWYRGCKETDRILGLFAREHAHSFADGELDMLEDILNESDSDLFNWISGKEPLPKKYKNNNVMKLLISFDVAEAGNWKS